MAKKLTAELDVDTSKAKRKVKEVVETGGGSAAGGDSVAPAAEKAAQELGKAARNARNFGDEAEKASSNVKNVARAFAGMGLGLAASFAESRFEEGSTARKAFGYAGAALSGAGSGGMAGGPWGAVAGAVIGLGKEYFDQDKADQEKAKERARETAENREMISDWEEGRKRTLAFKETLEALTKVEESLAERQKMVAEEIRKREEADRQLGETLRDAASGDGKEFRRLQQKRQTNASELDALLMASRQISNERQPESRPSYDALDALSRVGGAFGGSGGGALQTIAQTSSEQLRVLKSIDSKTHPGDSTWQ